MLIASLWIGLSSGALDTTVRADVTVRACATAPDCFAEALRALNRREMESARGLLDELRQQFPNTPWAGRAELVLGRQYQQLGDRQAIAHLVRVSSQLPILGDYAYYYLGEALYASSDWNGAATAFDLLSSQYPDSLLRPPALYWAGESWFQADDCRRAKERHAIFFTSYPKHVLAPAVLLRQGDCERKNGNSAAAIDIYRRIWVQFAAAPQATEAAIRLQSLKDKGVSLPELGSQDWWTRGKALFDAGQYAVAIVAIEEALKSPRALPDRSQALLDLGIARIRIKQYDEARPVLEGLVRSRSGTLSQEAALWLGRVYLRQGQEEPLLDLARDVESGFLTGEQKTKFLLLVAALHTDQGRSDKAISIYRQVAELAGSGTVGGEALWQAGWLHYREGRYEEAHRAFVDSARIQPAGPSAVQALYWQARTLEKLGQTQTALELFRTVCREAPNSYYCQIGGARKGWMEATRRDTSPSRGDGVDNTDPQDPVFQADIHYRRAMELRAIGWQREEADELATLLPKVGQDRTRALWLARVLAEAGEYHRALGLIRTFFVEVLDRADTGLQKGFWELAYPGGYLGTIQEVNGLRGIDAYLVTAVIREESSYNPLAVSSVGALGLMQVMPQTGQKIATQLGPQGFSRERLFEPCYNIRLGSAYLQQLGEKFGHNLVYIIAAYNAGPEAVAKWIQQFGDKDQDEFVESIPYTETRNYVKKVIRSYGEYKRIYGMKVTAEFLDKVC